jgi:Protein of unknown function (DUF1353)
MTLMNSMPAGADRRAPWVPGFDPDCTVDVRETDDTAWETLRALTYHGKVQDFIVPEHEPTDFASVPRMFVWFLPRYGRYTRAAILHDHLWRVAVPDGQISRLDADGLFRQAMRELGVPFLRRWIMWTAVRWGALTKPDGRQGWWKEAWRVGLVTLLALPLLLPAAAVIAVTLPIFYLLELLAWLPLRVTHAIRTRSGRAAKRVNAPALRWKL